MDSTEKWAGGRLAWASAWKLDAVQCVLLHKQTVDRNSEACFENSVNTNRASNKSEIVPKSSSQTEQGSPGDAARQVRGT